jgi:hypothetical protein
MSSGKSHFGQIASILGLAGTTFGSGCRSYDSGATMDRFRSQGRGNPNLKPEIKTEAEFGTDLEFFNRLQ